MKRTPLKPSKIVPRKTPMPRPKGPIKAKVRKTTPARAAAQGRPCLIRVPDYPCMPRDTVVGCHVPVVDHSGRGLKSSDTLIAYGCMSCHDIVDGRTHINHFTKDERRQLLLEGLARTIAYNAEHDHADS